MFSSEAANHHQLDSHHPERLPPPSPTAMYCQHHLLPSVHKIWLSAISAMSFCPGQGGILTCRPGVRPCETFFSSLTWLRSSNRRWPNPGVPLGALGQGLCCCFRGQIPNWLVSGPAGTDRWFGNRLEICSKWQLGREGSKCPIILTVSEGLKMLETWELESINATRNDETSISSCSDLCSVKSLP